MINLNIVPNEIGVAIGPDGNPMVTGYDRQAGIMVSIVVRAEFWQQFVQSAGRLKANGIVPATVEDIAAVAAQRNGGGHG